MDIVEISISSIWHWWFVPKNDKISEDCDYAPYFVEMFPQSRTSTFISFKQSVRVVPNSVRNLASQRYLSP